MRASKDHHRQALKIATFRLLEEAGGGEFAALTRVKAPALSKYKAQHEDEHFIPADVIADAELVAGQMIVTEALAKIHGKRLVDAAPRDAADADGVRAALDQIEDDTARLRLVVREAVRDHHIDRAESRDIRRRIDALRAALSDLEGMV